jgi:DNA-binding response OmpR family regulator
MAEHVLMIEDDEPLATMLSEYLGSYGFTVTARGTATDGLQRLRHDRFDALVLDVMLPDLDGFEVCRVRAESDIPILMLTARGKDLDRIVGLELGADDYLPKPFNPRELLARLRAILRRRVPSGMPHTALLRFGRLEIDRDARVVRVDSTERLLTSYQFELLCVLAVNAGRVMSREALLDRVRGEELDASTAALTHFRASVPP